MNFCTLEFGFPGLFIEKKIRLKRLKERAWNWHGIFKSTESRYASSFVGLFLEYSMD